MVANPAATPIIFPVADTVAIAGFEVLQVPPATEEEKVVDRPTQMACVPLNVPALGMAVTVMEIAFVAFGQPPKPVTVYVMVAVPAETPVTTPEFVLMVAMALLEELQVPPAIVEFKLVIFPTQIA